MVEVEVTKPAGGPMVEVMTPQGLEEIQSSLKEMFENIMPKRSKTSRVRVPEALEILAQEEATRLIDMDGRHEGGAPPRRAVGHRLPGRDRQDHRPRGHARPGRVARGRAARPPADRRGLDRQHEVRPGADDHVLFIASGAFHVAKPSDLLPEFQGPLPDPRRARRAHAERLHPHPDRARERAHPPVRALLATEDVRLEFTETRSPRSLASPPT
jgi:ATP-dependent HslUV protease ATP-binding subunit HslU